MERAQSRGTRSAADEGNFASDLQNSLDQAESANSAAGILLPNGVEIPYATAKATVSTPMSAAAATPAASGTETASTTTTSTAPGSSATATSSDVGAPEFMTSPEAYSKWMQAEKDYWAEQPKAVQAAKNAPSEAMADNLAADGYQVDMPVVAWGWDPVQLNFIRQQDGLPYDAALLSEAGLS